MNTFLKAGCLVLYGLALASLVWPFPNGMGLVVQNVALAIVAVHVLEMLFAFKHIKSYPGPLSTSILLALLFGLLHWAPLAKANRQSGKV